MVTEDIHQKILNLVVFDRMVNEDIPLKQINFCIQLGEFCKPLLHDGNVSFTNIYSLFISIICMNYITSITIPCENVHTITDITPLEVIKKFMNASMYASMYNRKHEHYLLAQYLYFLLLKDEKLFNALLESTIQEIRNKF